jgi:pilus assembly protein Flp/PilA
MGMKLGNRVMSFLREEQGPTATEYAVMFAIILLGALVGIKTIGSKVNTKFTEASQGW